MKYWDSAPILPPTPFKLFHEGNISAQENTDWNSNSQNKYILSSAWWFLGMRAQKRIETSDGKLIQYHVVLQRPAIEFS